MYKERRIILISIFVVIGLVFISRLFFIQVIDDSYALSADNQSHRRVKKYAPRGIMYDRNGVKVVQNEAIYDVMVTTRFITEDFDTLGFCSMIGISQEDFERRLDRIKQLDWYKSYKAFPFMEQLTVEEYGIFMEKLYRYSAFDVQTRNRRKIISNNCAHLIGDIGEVSQSILDNDSTYSRGDFLGKSGIERSYEEVLRGRNGYEIYVANSKNILKEKYNDGANDVSAIEGKNLTLSIDIDLQTYGEQLMKYKKGSIVAIEPSTGEILALVSSPSYNPNILSGKDRSENYRALLNNDSLNPLFNRALMAEYPPGSIFKLVQALVGLEEGVIKPSTGYSCNKALVGCHNHPRANNLAQGVKFSCNPYFYNVFHEILNDGPGNRYKVHARNLDKWAKYMRSFGLGKPLYVDIYGEKSGQIPTSKYYNKIYGEYRWQFSTVYSLSIGQGEILVSPIQMANIAAIMANRGYYYIPHAVKEIVNDTLPKKFTTKNYTLISPQHFEPIIEGMERVVNEGGGTARRARIKDIIVCGKTGTAQNPHGEDHSIFIAFAPKDNPKIAVSVYVENAGFGGTWAAPIASLIIEKYLKEEVDKAKEEYILEKRFYGIEEEKSENLIFEGP